MIASVELEVAGGGSGAVDGVGDSSPGGSGVDASGDVSDDIPCCRYSAVIVIRDYDEDGGANQRWW